MPMWLSHRIACLPPLLLLYLSPSVSHTHTHMHQDEQAKACQCNPCNAPYKLEHPPNKIWVKKTAGEGMFAMQIIKEEALLLLLLFVSGLSMWVHVTSAVLSHLLSFPNACSLCVHVFVCLYVMYITAGVFKAQSVCSEVSPGYVRTSMCSISPRRLANHRCDL